MVRTVVVNSVLPYRYVVIILYVARFLYVALLPSLIDSIDYAFNPILVCRHSCVQPGVIGTASANPATNDAFEGDLFLVPDSVVNVQWAAAVSSAGAL